MTLPTEWAQVPITAVFLNRDGSPASGYVTFDAQIPVSIAGTIVCPGTITVQLDGTGAININLPATNDPDLNITGWAYTVTEHISGGGRPPYSLEVPFDSAGIDLSTLDVAANNPSLPLLRGSKGDPGPQGPIGPGAERNAVTAIASASGELPVDYTAGNYFTIALAENIGTFSFTNLPGGPVGITFAFLITQGASPYSITWPASFDWGASVVAPTMPGGVGAQMVVVINSFDNGVTWDASARVRD